MANQFIYLFTLVIYLCAPATRGSAPAWVPAEEMAALQSFYTSLAGDKWANNSGWATLGTGEPTDPCGSATPATPVWFGLNCSTSGNSSHVSGIELSDNNLLGTLPSLVQLGHLRILDVSSSFFNVSNPNIITQSTQECFSGLPRSLQVARFGYNRITGSLAGCLDHLPQLIQLSMIHTEIVGEIPSLLCELPYIEDINFRGTGITGTIPTCIGQASSLQSLDLGSEGKDPASNLPGKLMLNGTIPDSICNLPELTRLNLQNTRNLVGPIPSCLGAAQRNLFYVLLQGNRLSGTIPDSLCAIGSGLAALLLSSNQLTGNLPQCLGEQLESLQELDVSANQLSGSIPDSFCQTGAWKNTLERLELDHNKFSGSIPPCIGRLTSLKRLTFSRNKITGTLPEELCSIKTLENLEAYYNKMRGHLAPCLATSFSLLQNLFLQGNDFSGNLPETWSLPRLQVLLLSTNTRLGGSLPSSLFHQQGLEEVPSLNHELTSVVIDGTMIRGAIPEAACTSSRSLRVLSLCGNYLSHRLPKCMGGLSMLETLALRNNQLTGSISSNVVNLTSLQVIDLRHNRLTGTVPGSFGDMSMQLSSAHLDFNRLSCELPPSVLRWKKSHEFTGVSVLNGNLFGCSNALDLAFSMADVAPGLKDANLQETSGYMCGYMEWIPPCAIFVLYWLFLFVARAALIYTSDSNDRRCDMCVYFSSSRRKLFDSTQNGLVFQETMNHITKLAVCTAGAAAISGLLMFVTLHVAGDSQYTCQYNQNYSIAAKKGDMKLFGAMIGGAVAVGIIFGAKPWWDRLGQRKMSGAASSRKPLSLTQFIKAVALALLLVMASFVPNIAYVLVEIDANSNASSKQVAKYLIVCAKTSLVVTLVPWASRKQVDIIWPPGQSAEVTRFNARLLFRVILFALTQLLIPVLVVLISDPRCFYYAFNEQDSINTQVSVQECTVFAPGQCLGYTTKILESQYRPQFQYSGEECTSAWVTIYAPILNSASILITGIPAALEFVLVPRLAPILHSQSSHSKISHGMLQILRTLTWNVDASIALHSGQDVVGRSMDEADGYIRRSIERCYGELCAMLLVALTVGLAAPYVAVICSASALILRIHHEHVISQLVSYRLLLRATQIDISDLWKSTSGIELHDCTHPPIGCIVCISFTTMIVWGLAAFDFLPWVQFWGTSLVVAGVLIIGFAFASSNDIPSCFTSPHSPEGQMKSELTEPFGGRTHSHHLLLLQEEELDGEVDNADGIKIRASNWPSGPLERSMVESSKLLIN